LSWVPLAVVAAALSLGACDEYGTTADERGVDPTPEKLDGSSSQEFEAEDIGRANSASQAGRDYCSGAVSEAQEVGCLSHADESDIP
jgi:hypothetical protein